MMYKAICESNVRKKLFSGMNCISQLTIKVNGSFEIGEISKAIFTSEKKKNSCIQNNGTIKRAVLL